ncbi:MAG: hypothetical protein JWN40_5687 [Phycisphaerales bacterium]|nr:hypothetical protein [Phycisphaerales bacterium]
MPTPPPPRPPWLLFILESKHTFKFVAFVYFAILFGASFGLINLLSDDPQTFRDFGVLVAVLTIFVAGILAHLTLRALGADKPLYEDDRRSKVMLFGGFGAAILLALLLSIYNHSGTVTERKSQENNRVQREMLGRFSK